MESIRENGLVLHSDYKGEIAARPERAVPIDQMGEQDIIFVCVKTIRWRRPAVTSRTLSPKIRSLFP